MEADWEVEVAPGAPQLDGAWPGFIDLKQTPQRASELEEVRRFPPLGEALIKLNQTPLPGIQTSLRTAKCDLWQLAEWDADELDAADADSTVALACYVDLFPAASRVFPDVNAAVAWARAVVAELHALPQRCCRADLVVRLATVREIEGFAVTAYLSACGATADAAETSLANALQTFVDAATR